MGRTFSTSEMHTVQSLVGKPEGMRLVRPRRRWEDDIKMDLREVDCDPRQWIALAQDRDQCRPLIWQFSLSF